MSVFLRWGIFGILLVAALLYAYNASKSLADARARRTVAESAAPRAAPGAEEKPVAERRETPAVSPAVDAAISPRCAIELHVARRALEARKQGEPLDRVLRMPEIAWEDSPERRNRLAKVATDWFDHEGEWTADALRIAVIGDCEQHSPAG